jgi:phosphomannomutase
MTTAHAFNPQILREYDIRGTMGKSLSEADAYAIGRTFASQVKADGGQRVAVGRDGRLSSPGLADAVVQGVVDAGLTAYPIGMGPTPMLYFAVQHLGTDGGIMVTGSHNPPQDNGFKMALKHRPFYGADIKALGRIAGEGSWSSGTGAVEPISVFDAYIDRLASEASGAVDVAWDPGNGAAGDATVALTRRLAGKHILLNEVVDGTFPAHHPDPTEDHNLVQLQDAVKAHGCALGIAFDGDGDRIGAIDETGRIVRADQFMMILAEDVLREVPGATIVGDVKCSQTLFDHIAAKGGQPLMWKTGHSLVKAKMKETGAPLAGEMSGHIFFAHRYYGYDDALYAAMRLLGALTRAGRSLKDFADSFPVSLSTPELRIPCEEDAKFQVIADLVASLKAQGARVTDIDGARVATDDGWWLLRASNTQAVLVARAEATSPAGLDRLLSALSERLHAVGLSLPTGPAGH